MLMIAPQNFATEAKAVATKLGLDPGQLHVELVRRGADVKYPSFLGYLNEDRMPRADVYVSLSAALERLMAEKKIKPQHAAA